MAMNDLLRRTIEAARTRLSLARKASSFAAVGVVNALVDYGVWLVAYEVVGLALIPANVIAWMVAVSGSYVMNSYVTFAAESGRRLTPRAYVTFVASGILGLIANTTALVLASYVMPVRLAKILAIGASFLV